MKIFVVAAAALLALAATVIFFIIGRCEEAKWGTLDIHKRADSFTDGIIPYGVMLVTGIMTIALFATLAAMEWL